MLIPIFLRYIVILSSHLCLGLPQGLFPVCVPAKILKVLLPSSILATWPVLINFLDLITLTILGERYKLWSFSLFSLLHSPFSLLLVPNIRFSILFSNTLSLDSSLNVRDHVSQPYSTTGNIIVLYILRMTTDYQKKLQTWREKNNRKTTNEMGRWFPRGRNRPRVLSLIADDDVK